MSFRQVYQTKYIGVIVAIVFLLITLAAIPTRAEISLRVEISTLLELKELIIEGPVTIKADGSSYIVQQSVNILCKAEGEYLIYYGLKEGMRATKNPLYFSSPKGRITIVGDGLQGEYSGDIEIKAKGNSLEIINNVHLEDYVAGVLGNEMPLSWEEEALKAQGVLIRGFALSAGNRHKDFDLCSSSHCQVYKGFSGNNSRALAIAHKTEGEILSKDGFVLPVFYHSACGGQISLPQDIWGETQTETAHLYSGPCQLANKALCQDSPYFTWERKMNSSEWQSLWFDLDQKDIKVKEKDIIYGKEGRIVGVELAGKVYPFLDIWSKVTKKFGWGFWPSNYFTIREEGEQIIFSGQGLGHGVGLCQWGARELARLGFTYKDILAFYFPGAELSNIQNQSKK